ncbi:hypothetical protein CY35_09G028300 [Sphagnum magellanicum]|nr:hypothetical protein CY35_09G028300 [Sphagnum magellanicum]KAH9551731.1 hypothetical protein CY35_09G028300 [Sphagnum magellanicum]
MAYFGKLGALSRQMVATSMLQKSGAAAAAALPAVYMLQRGMASSKLFIGGLAWATDEQTLKEAFSSFGEVIEAKIICDRDTGRSRGFGFVSFKSEQEAEVALQEMDGRDLAGRTIRVDYATQRAPGERPGGSLPRGGGGYSPTGVHRENSTFGGSNDFGGGGSFGGNSDWRGM